MKLSVRIITYNHEKFIAQTIESVLMQRTGFDYEIVIGDDCSIDRTRDIILEYKAKYPGIIRTLFQEKNVGMVANNIQTVKTCTGQYIALLDGDDYWTSPDKLQKQVDFLESHPDFSLCFHPVEILKEDKSQKPPRYYGWGPGRKKSSFGVADLIKYDNFIPTSSIVRRKEINDFIPDWFLNLPYSDWAQNILSARYGKIGRINEVIGVYRSHPGGVWGSLSELNMQKKRVESYLAVGKHFGLKKKRYFRRALERHIFLLANEYAVAGDLTRARITAMQGFLRNPFAISSDNIKMLSKLSFSGLKYFGRKQ